MVLLRKPITGVSESSLTRFVARARRAAGLRGQITVLVTDSAEMRGLNRRFRGYDRATDVLSFPAAIESGNEFEGDIAISAEIAARNAVRLGHTLPEELKILVLHGLLHLAGFDHERDRGEMAYLESRLRRELRLPDGLIERVSPTSTHQKKTGARYRVAPIVSAHNKRRTNSGKRAAAEGSLQ